MTLDELYMSRAIQLAKLAMGKTNPNPLVGAVVVHGDKIIGEGYHEKFGQPHAEVNAINDVKKLELLSESTIYVTLEPCSHFGKTPPCANLLLEKGIKRVVIGTQDPNPQVAGKGIELLRNAGVVVDLGILESDCKALNPGFMCYHSAKRPYIHLKWAESSDGFLDNEGTPAKISEPESDLLVHEMRNKYHAILVGKNTAKSDNPSLTCRNPGGTNPIRVVLDSKLELSQDLHLFDRSVATYVLNAIKQAEEDNLKYILLKDMKVSSILEALWHENIVSVLVEGGAQTLNSFIESGLWDECLIIRNERKLVQGTKAPTLDSTPISSEQILGDTHLRFKKAW